MRVLFDACVLYPTVLRRILIGVCAEGLAEPVWSPRILEEWARAAARLDEGEEAVARAEIALLSATWPSASVEPFPETEARLSLPDPGDLHVLAAAMDGGAETLVTLNLRDFPVRTLARHGVAPCHPDVWLLSFMDTAPEAVARVVHAVHADAQRISGETLALRGLLKRARLPRLARRLAVLDPAPL